MLFKYINESEIHVKKCRHNAYLKRMDKKDNYGAAIFCPFMLKSSMNICQNLSFRAPPKKERHVD